MQIIVVSNVAPDGRIRYAFGVSTWIYRQRGMAVNTVSQDSFSIAKFVAQAVVKDEQGLPVEGAALHIGKEVVHTDSAGQFQLRCSRHGPYAISVAPDEFFSNSIYEVASAPSEVRAEADTTATDIQITLRHKVVPSR